VPGRALSTLHLAVGAPSITYHRSVNGRTDFLPPRRDPYSARLPKEQLRFRAILRFR
jgi:hypothetical protein